MKIITISTTSGIGGYVANVHKTSGKPLQSFAKTEVGALEQLVEKIKKQNKKFILTNYEETPKL